MCRTYVRVAWLLIAVASAGSLGAAGLGARAIVDAAKAGDRVALRALIKQRANVNAPEADGMTALHWAVQANDVESAQLLIRAGANVKASNRDGITPLSVAALNASAPLAEILLKAGADPNVAGPAGETPLMTAARSGKPDVVRALIAHGAEVNARESAQGQTALMWAAIENQVSALKVLIERGADLNARSKVLATPDWKWVTIGMVSTSLPRGNWTSLMYAARQNSIDAALALVDAGAEVNLTDPDGATALVVAIINAHFDLANALLDKGADPNIADETGMAALYATVDMHTLGPTMMRPAPKRSDKLDGVDLVKALLGHGANPNARLKKPILGRLHDAGDPLLGEGTTPLMRAAKTTDVPVLRLLLDAGADPTLTQRDYTNAVMIAGTGGARATDKGALETIKLCLDHGADVNAFNASGQTAVHNAAARGADQIVKLLASRGATLDIPNKQGRTPLDLALGVGGGGGRRGRGGAATVHESTAALLRQLLGGSPPASSLQPQ